MRLAKNKRSEVRSVSGISEFQVSEVKRTEICWTNYPLCEAHKYIPEAERDLRFHIIPSCFQRSNY